MPDDGIETIILEADGDGPALELLRTTSISHETNRPPILFVHGYTAGAWQFAQHIMPALAAEGWTSYALNLRGHGGSGGREAIRTTRFADYAADVARAAAHVEGAHEKKIVLVGHSLGSVLARHHSSMHPVAGLGLVSFGDIRIGMKGFMGWMMRRFPVQAMVGMLTGRPSRMFARFEPQYAVMYEGQERETVRANVEQLMAQPDSDKVFKELGKLSIGTPLGDPPVLILAGDNDPIASTESMHALAAASGLEPVILDGGVHDLFAGSTWQRTYSHLSKWLDEIQGDIGSENAATGSP